jgi:hypothetical protein
MARFADYLLVCGAIGEPNWAQLRDGCIDLYRKALKTYEETDPVPRLMPKLPLE